MIAETSRLRLRTVEEADAAFIRELMNEPPYLEHIGDRGVRTDADAAAYIADKFKRSYAQNGFGLYLVETRDTATAVGICGLVKRDVLSEPDIGFAYLQRFWSQGFALEAARATVQLADERFRLPMLHALIAPANARSIRLVEKLGFAPNGRIQLPGQAFESLLFTRKSGDRLFTGSAAVTQ